MPILLPSIIPDAITWMAWAERIAPSLEGCPKMLIGYELRDSAIRFYRDTRAWRATNVTIATTVAGTADYSVSLPTSARLAGLPTLWLDSKEVAEATPGAVDELAPNDTASATRIAVIGTATIRITPTPVLAGLVLLGTVAYCPTDDSSGITEPLYFAHRDAIESMVLARMLAQPSKPWTNFALAGKYAAEETRLLLHEGTQAGPLRRTRLRTRKAGI